MWSRIQEYTLVIPRGGHKKQLPCVDMSGKEGGLSAKTESKGKISFVKNYERGKHYKKMK